VHETRDAPHLTTATQREPTAIAKSEAVDHRFLAK
jgi:hypothetical protein